LTNASENRPYHHSAQSKTSAHDAASAQQIRPLSILAHHQRINMKSREVFMALMVGKGYAPEDLTWDGKKFVNTNITTRWNYFLLGWEMRGVA